MASACISLHATSHPMFSYGLPTRSRVVSEFMMGLEKTKAKAGETSVSARALELQDMHRLYDHCVANPQASAEERHQGIVRYVSGLSSCIIRSILNFP